MQSTGHTSTHERSFTLMHGSAMMYVIPALQWIHDRTANIVDWDPLESSPARALGCLPGDARDGAPCQERQNNHQQAVLREDGRIGLIRAVGEAGARRRGEPEQHQQALAGEQPQGADQRRGDPALGPDERPESAAAVELPHNVLALVGPSRSSLAFVRRKRRKMRATLNLTAPAAPDRGRDSA